MELKLYFRIIQKYWWIILGTFILTMIPTYLFVNSQPWIYETSATFVIRPRASIGVNGDEIVDALDTISRRVEINTTFAEVSSSSLVKQRAIAALDLTPEEQQGLAVNGRVIAGTNILEVTVQGPNPAVVHDFARAITAETLVYVGELYDVFELEPLDEASLPSNPVSPDKTLNLALGGGLSLLLGIGLIFLVQYLQEPAPADAGLNVIDRETGAYNRDYFTLRLRQELSRSRHNNYTFSIAFVKVFHRGLVHEVAQSIPAAKVLRLLLTSMEPNLRDEDILAYMGQHRFALLLPHMPGDAAKDLLTFLQSRLSMVSPQEINESQTTSIRCAVGIVVSRLNAKPGEMLAQAAQALEEAETAVYGQVHLFTPTANSAQQTNGRSPLGPFSPEVSR